jgi:Domain of unknown function (DUF4936)
MAAARQLFVYYRVDSALEAQAIRVVHKLQQQLRAQHPGLSATLMRREDVHDGACTLMEIYAARGDGIGEELQRSIEAAAARDLASIETGPRHVEVFEACA